MFRFGLVQFLFTLQFSQQSQNLTTSPTSAKINHWTKRSGAVLYKKKEIKKRGGKAPVNVNNHGYPALYTLICEPVKLLPHPDAECVKCMSIFMCVFQHTFYVGVCPNNNIQ